MKNIFKSMIIILGIVIATPAFSSEAANGLGNCMIDALNGKERKQLARWIFFAIAAHPEIKSYSSATSNDIKNSDQVVGKLITRLLTVDCPKQLVIAEKANPLALQQSFELVGQVAMQELMTDKKVLQAITSYSKYADLEKINALLADK